MNASKLTNKLHLIFSGRQRILVAGALGAILPLGGFLHFYDLGQTSLNEYYAAAVKNTVLSRRNFLSVAFGPGGSVSLDKPPLGFWIEASNYESTSSSSNATLYDCGG